MTNPGNNNTVYCTTDKEHYFISRDKGKSWQPVKNTNFTLSIVNGEILYGYVGSPSYTSDGKIIHSSDSTTYPFAPFIKCNNNIKNDFQLELDALRTLMFNNGARLTWDRNVRIGYDFILKKMTDYYRNQIKTGKMTPRKAGWSAKFMRNNIMKALRLITHPIGLKKEKMHKVAGMSNYKAFKSAVANVKTKQYLPKNFNNLSKMEQETIRKPIKEKIMRDFNKNPNEIREIFNADKTAVYEQMIESAGNANDKFTRQLKFPEGLSLIERRLFLMSLVISFFNVIMAEDPVDALAQEVAIDFVLFVGGFVGGTIASATACKGTGSAAVYCVIASNLLGGVIAVEEYHHLNGN